MPKEDPEQVPEIPVFLDFCPLQVLNYISYTLRANVLERNQENASSGVKK
jgi:hypothetical protein